ncbi:helix-turn-helix domain-containing protein [Sphingomonas canadensis]|uniref:Helix-turn-helix domain-containing protein n=1 Tax=Sphingomonas canadensis TaxID=1219257 RepID=A0ABW3H4Q8_9SPHN|nr:helix-turn-helix transcriptional regulator [Sphingomonas canadensis]MCW3836013.1 helix-turn-helix domain-containing protein [Sphingomonas canadensis]
MSGGQSDRLAALGKRLREERKEKRFTQTAFSELAGVHKNSQIAYEAGRTPCTVEYLLRLAECGVDIGYVLTGRRADIKPTAWADPDAAADAAADAAYARAAFERQAAALREATREDRRIGELVVRRRAELLLELIDQRAQRVRIVDPPFGLRRLLHGIGYLKHLFRRALPDAFEQPQHGELELPDDGGVALQLALKIFDHGELERDVRVHGDFPAGGDSRRVTEAAGGSTPGRGGDA